MFAGKGSFNYRLKFPIELGPRSRAFKFPHLSLQMWDRDIVKWNDCIAEVRRQRRFEVHISATLRLSVVQRDRLEAGRLSIQWC